MELLFIQPPIRDFYRTKFREYPLGILYLAAAAEAAGHKARVLDARRCKRPRRVAIPPELKYLDNYYTRANNLFLNYKHIGMEFDEIAQRAARIGPDKICLSSMFTPYVGEAIEAAVAIKKVMPRCPIVAGGHHATVDPDSLSNSGCIDEIVKGEGERMFIRADPLDSLPFPARHLIDADNYRIGKKRYTMILSSRGCPHSCSFCSVHAVCGRTHRIRSIDSVLAEIEECVQKFNIEVFDFQDDNLLYEPERIKALLEKIIRQFNGGIELLASNGLNVSSLDEELLALMKRAGFKKLDLALGTGDVPSREFLKRPETTGQYEDVLKIANRLELPVTTYIILGLPTQTLAEMKQTVEYLKIKNTLISPSIFYNVPGMPMFEVAAKYEYQQSHIARRSSAFNSFGADFTRDDIFLLFKSIREGNLLKITK